jgi:short-chain Z-isoprenyl diphosphate synthase
MRTCADIGVRSRCDLIDAVDSKRVACGIRGILRRLSLWRGYHRCLRSLLGPIYDLYEYYLALSISQGNFPHHIGVILDGNRRYGRENGLSDFDRIYERGANRLDDVVTWCADLGIQAVTLWVCSTDNLGRSQAEVSSIFSSIERKIRALTADPLTYKLGIRVQTIGRLVALPESLKEVLDAACLATAANDRLTLTIAAGYGGQEEVADAVRELITRAARSGLSPLEIAESVTPLTISQHFYQPALPNPDLIIRTSGEVRISGFMLWRSVYSELYFADVNWPDVRRIDLLRAIRTYQGRSRRFGR